MKGGVPLELGARALDVLIALVSTPNEVVSKKELMSRVWPGITVEEASLRFHMAGLRKLLGDGKDGARYITTLKGRGYCFVAPITPVTKPHIGASGTDSHVLHTNLPSRLNRMVGRDEEVLKLSAELNAWRFVTIVGPGGVGKTTVAVAVAHHLAAAFAGSVLFVDLGILSDPKLAGTAIASMLGLSVQSDDATQSLVAYLRDKRILVILDTCEHLVDEVAELAAHIMNGAPKVHILATSREPLRVEGEHVYRLEALAYPPESPGLTAAAMRQFPATQLFIERALASGARLSVSDAEAPIVASICRKLDGVALAIELAARRVNTYGLQQTAALLDQHLTLLWHGSRDATRRHQTLHATLDWSYQLLSELERVVLRRLAIFVGPFTLDAALAVATGTDVNEGAIFSAIDGLTAKSMIATRPIGAMMRYRLLDTTRAYILDIGSEDPEIANLATQHATYFKRWLEQSGKEWAMSSSGVERESYFADLNNVRAALEWCFGEGGDLEIGIALAVSAAPVFLAMSLLPECYRWSQRAIAALSDMADHESDKTQLDAHLEMKLRAALAGSVTAGGGTAAEIESAWTRTLDVAESLGDVDYQLRALFGLWMIRDREALALAQRFASVAATPADRLISDQMLGYSYHFLGDQGSARRYLEHVVAKYDAAIGSESRIIRFQIDHQPTGFLARVLWLQGLPQQAMAMAERFVDQAKARDHASSLCHALAVVGCRIALWIGNLELAEQYIEVLDETSNRHGLALWHALGRAHRGVLLIKRGDLQAGLRQLRVALEECLVEPTGYHRTLFFVPKLAEALGHAGQTSEGLATLEEAMDRADRTAEGWIVAELLRMKGELLLIEGMPDATSAAEACFRQALQLAEAQGALSWQLRAATSFARMLHGCGRSSDAMAILQPVYGRFTEGFETADVRAARTLLASAGHGRPDDARKPGPLTDPSGDRQAVK